MDAPGEAAQIRRRPVSCSSRPRTFLRGRLICSDKRKDPFGPGHSVGEHIYEEIRGIENTYQETARINQSTKDKPNHMLIAWEKMK